VLVYVDDLLVISERPEEILTRLSEEQRYRLKDVGTPTRFLGAKIGKKTFDGLEYWYLSAEAYLEKALNTVEERFGKLDTLFGKSRWILQHPLTSRK
jgi:hypothetical protein